jgi:hypothetical protein
LTALLSKGPVAQQEQTSLNLPLHSPLCSTTDPRTAIKSFLKKAAAFELAHPRGEGGKFVSKGELDGLKWGRFGNFRNGTAVANESFRNGTSAMIVRHADPASAREIIRAFLK